MVTIEDGVFGVVADSASVVRALTDLGMSDGECRRVQRPELLS
jgi:hypothetical protein